MNKYYTIILFLVSGVGYSQTTHHVTVDINQGPACPVVTALENSPIFKIYPNPADQSFNIESEHSKARYALFNSEGKVLRIGRLQNGSRIVDVRDLNPGIYILRIENGSMKDQIKLQIQ